MSNEELIEKILNEKFPPIDDEWEELVNEVNRRHWREAMTTLLEHLQRVPSEDEIQAKAIEKSSVYFQTENIRKIAEFEFIAGAQFSARYVPSPPKK